MKPLAKPAIEVVKQGKVKFVPKDLQRYILIGWKTFGTGVYPDSFGGAIVYLPGTAKNAEKPPYPEKI